MYEQGLLGTYYFLCFFSVYILIRNYSQESRLHHCISMCLNMNGKVSISIIFFPIQFHKIQHDSDR